MLSEGKQTKDMTLAQHMFTCGVGYRLAIHDTGRKGEEYLDEAPFEMYVTEPMNSFVVRSSDVSKRVVMGVTYVFKTPPASDVEYTVYTPNVTYTIADGEDGLEIKNRVRHNFGMVNLIEYPCNPNYMSAIEPVIPILNMINLLESNQALLPKKFCLNQKNQLLSLSLIPNTVDYNSLLNHSTSTEGQIILQKEKNVKISFNNLNKGFIYQPINENNSKLLNNMSQNIKEFPFDHFTCNSSLNIHIQKTIFNNKMIKHKRQSL